MSNITPQQLNSTLTILLRIISTVGPLTELGISAIGEIKALSGLTDEQLEEIWITRGTANQVEIAKRRIEIASRATM